MSRTTRRLIWSAPLVAALAVVGALALFVAQGPQPAQAHDPPGAVTNLTVTAASPPQNHLSWDAPDSGGAPTGYRIDRSRNGNVWKTVTTTDTPATSYSDTEVMGDWIYYYRVFAVNEAGPGPVSQDYRVTTRDPQRPSRVRNLMATAQGRNQINLSWDPPLHDNGWPISHYYIHWAPGNMALPGQGESESNANVERIPVSAGTTYEHKGLVAGERYRYVVYAANNRDNPFDRKSQAASDMAEARTEPRDPPGPPSGLTVAQESGLFLLYWHAPTENGGAPVDGYEVHVSLNGKGFVNISDAANAPAGYGSAPWSDDATVISDAQHDVPATDPDGDAVTRVQYRVYAFTGTATDPLSSAPRYAQTPVITVLSQAQLTANVLGPPAFTNANTADLDAERDLFGNVNLKWTAPAHGAPGTPSSVGGYRIDVSDDGIHWSGLVRHSGKTTTQFHYVDDEKKNRHYRIHAWHAQYLSQAQTNQVVSRLTTGDPVAPSHVRNLTATPVSSTTIALAWDEPASDGGAPIVRYRVDAVGYVPNTSRFQELPQIVPANPCVLPSDSERATRQAFCIDGSSTTFTHSGLKGGETWQYRVIPLSNDGSTNRRPTESNADTRIATTLPALPAEAPEGLVAEDAKDSNLSGVADRGVLLLWNETVPGAGGTIDGYRIQRMSNGGAWETIAEDTDRIHTDYTDLEEPAADELRAYRVAALDGDLVGMYTDPVYYPHALTMHNRAPMVGSAIANQTVMVGGTVTVPSTITDPDMGDMLTWNATSDMDTVATAMVDGMGMVTITGMMEGMATITVTAMDSSGESAMQTIMVTVEAAQLTAPTNVATMVNGADVTITWTDGMGAAQHAVILFDEDFNFGSRIAGQQDDGMHTFQNVPSGTYTAVVVALDAEYEMELAFATVTVP